MLNLSSNSHHEYDSPCPQNTNDWDSSSFLLYSILVKVNILLKPLQLCSTDNISQYLGFLSQEYDHCI